MPPVNAAASDPALVPGLASLPGAVRPAEQPRAGEAGAEKAAAQDTDTAEAAEDAEATEATEATGATEGEDVAGAGPAEKDATAEKAQEDTQDAEDAEDAADAADAADAGGGSASDVSFEAADHRGSITAERAGVRLRLDDQEAFFTWPEIAAVEHRSSLTGRWFSVVVHTQDRRYPAEVQGAGRRKAAAWADQLEKVLDAYFQE